jgi:hypothetical protein
MAARRDEKRNANWVLVEKTEGKNHLENLGVDGRKTLKWHVNKKVWADTLVFVFCMISLYLSAEPKKRYHNLSYLFCLIILKLKFAKKTSVAFFT